MIDGLSITERGGAVRFAVRVIPRGRRSAIDGLHGGALKVRLNAPPVDGAANAELVALLASTLDVPRRAVSIVSGVTARTKLVEVTGVEAARIERSLARSLAPDH